MNRALTHSETTHSVIGFGAVEGLKASLPVTAPLILSALLIFTRAWYGQIGFLYESALTVLALMCYLTASALFLTNLFVKEKFLGLPGLIAVSLGYCFNLSGWMIRWIEAGEQEGWINGSVWRYFPLDNLYSLTLGFCAGAALALLLIIRKPEYSMIGALAMPIVSVIMLQAFFFGGEIKTLPPILNSYWLPMHVTTATFGYGAALASFGIAIAYLIKDGVRAEAFGIAAAALGVVILAAAGGGAVLMSTSYGPSLTIENQPLPVRAELYGIGPLMFGLLIAMAAILIVFVASWVAEREEFTALAWKALGVSALVTGAVIGIVFYQVSYAESPVALLAGSEYSRLGAFLAENMNLNVPEGQHALLAQRWLQENGARVGFSFNSNPVEFAGLITLFVALSMTTLLGFKRKAIADALPSRHLLDSLLYRTVGVVVPLLTLLLITGAVWANESWGRYWGWDPKEVGALVSWMAFAAYLHLRFVKGWKGRRSAYIVLIGFGLIIFTWLGVSYLLPGLHSYA